MDLRPFQILRFVGVAAMRCQMTCQNLRSTCMRVYHSQRHVPHFPGGAKIQSPPLAYPPPTCVRLKVAVKQPVRVALRELEAVTRRREQRGRVVLAHVRVLEEHRVGKLLALREHLVHCEPD